MKNHGIHGNLLEITVVGCNKLKDTEWISRQDPYVCVEYGSNRNRTRVCTVFRVQLAKVLSCRYDDSSWPLQTKTGRNPHTVMLHQLHHMVHQVHLKSVCTLHHHWFHPRLINYQLHYLHIHQLGLVLHHLPTLHTHLIQVLIHHPHTHLRQLLIHLSRTLLVLLILVSHMAPIILMVHHVQGLILHHIEVPFMRMKKKIEGSTVYMGLI